MQKEYVRSNSWLRHLYDNSSTKHAREVGRMLYGDIMSWN